MRVTVDPAAMPSSEFTYAAPSEQTLRIKGCENKHKEGSEYGYLAWEFEFADPNIQGVEEKGKVGKIFENTSLKPSAQFRLRDLCDALGLSWGDFDTDSLKGMEFRAKVGLDQYQGKFKNVVDRYIKK